MTLKPHNAKQQIAHYGNLYSPQNTTNKQNLTDLVYELRLTALMTYRLSVSVG